MSQKKNWIVVVQMSVGHEFADSFCETDIYGPYTEKQAKQLAKELDAFFEAKHLDEPEEDRGSERQEARATIIDSSHPYAVYSRYADEGKR